VAKLHLLFVIFYCTVVLHTCPVYACRYNVREVGFIDVGIDPYYLFAYVPQETSSEAIKGLREALDTALIDTNVRFEPASAGADANRPEMQFVASHKIGQFPAAVLVSPDGQSRPVDLDEAGGTLAQRLLPALEDLLDSPTRRVVLEKSAESYGVVLLIEGPGADDNRLAREAVSAAVTRIAEQLEFLPKPIARPPEMVVLERQSLAREQVLLWSLGLEPEDVNKPHAAVFYGRGRWIGPLFAGETLNADNLTELLFVIGADCECGLDHRWLQGTMLPARWTQELQAKAAESLGFDPENPMIKMEMVSIIRRGMGGFAYPGVPFGYQEIEVAGEAPDLGDSADPRGSADPCVQGVGEVPEKAGPLTSSGLSTAPEAAYSGHEGGEFGMLITFLGCGALLAGVAGMIVFLRAKKA
jgi:hypothetical protein